MENRKRQWRILESSFRGFRPEQWPPEGTSPTEGWILTRWNQTYPYNKFCPIDPVSNLRSYAGCPAIAISQIINYYKIIHQISFSDQDDYHHSFAGRVFWIDDDYEDRDFPSFPELNEYLRTLDDKYLYSDENLGNDDKASLIFATGVAATQVYSSEVSGVFYESQISDSYNKFDYSNEIILPENDFYDRIIQNIQNAMPVQLSVLTESQDAGHQLIIDGYNTDNFYHLNFGWGGSSDGWYHIPDDLPYSLTVISCAFVDIAPPDLEPALIMGNIILNPIPENNNIVLEALSSIGFYSLEITPNMNGNTTEYAFSLPIGRYRVTASIEGYECISSDEIDLYSNDIYSLDFELNKMFSPTDLSASYDNGEINLSWTFNGERGFEHFNIYRKAEEQYVLIDTTMNVTYTDAYQSVVDDTIFYYVTAKYSQQNESEPSDTVFVLINAANQENEVATPCSPIVFPNPFNPETHIRFYADIYMIARLYIYNLKGQLVFTKRKRIAKSGYNTFDWKGINFSGQKVASGIYLYKLILGKKTFGGKIILLK